MLPKIGYLIDDSEKWEDPNWKFYTENEAPDYVHKPHWSRPEEIKRIVYWEVEDDQ